MKLTALVSTLFAGFALADLHTLIVLRRVNEATIAYHKSLDAFDGSFSGATSLLTKTRRLANTLRTASGHASVVVEKRTSAEEEEQNEQEAFDLSYNLAQETKAAVNTAIEKKKLMTKFPFGGKVAVRSFRELRDAAQGLGNNVIPKASDHKLEESKKILKQIDDEFERGLEAFQKS